MSGFEVEGRKFRFSCCSGEIICECLELLPDGTIGGYEHPNEHRWEVEDGCVVFKGRDGCVTTIFEPDWRNRERRTLYGKFSDVDVYHDILTELRPENTRKSIA